MLEHDRKKRGDGFFSAKEYEMFAVASYERRHESMTTKFGLWMAGNNAYV